MRDLSLVEVETVSGGLSTGFYDSIAGAIVDGLIGASVGGLTGGANGGAAGSGGLLGFGIIAQGVGFVAGIVLGSACGVALGWVQGFSGSGDLIKLAEQGFATGGFLPHAKS